VTDHSDWLTVDQAAAALNTSDRTVRRMIRDHKIGTSTRPRHGRRPEVICDPRDVEMLKQASVQMVVVPPDAQGPLGAPREAHALTGLDVVLALMDRLQPPRNGHEKAFLNLGEASDRTGLTKACLKRLARSGDIVAFKDRGWKFSRRDLDNLDTAVQIGGTMGERLT
jgi:excisionase family DNA binding protein